MPPATPATFETAPTVLDATALLIPFACYWELAHMGHLPSTLASAAESTATVDSAASADSPDASTRRARFPGRRMVPPGWAMPTMPPMMLQLLVGRFVRHIGWVRQGAPGSARAPPTGGTPHRRSATPNSSLTSFPTRSAGLAAAMNVSVSEPTGALAAALGPSTIPVTPANVAAASAAAAAAAPQPQEASVTDADAELDVLMVRGKSTSYWEGDDDGSSTRGTPTEDVYVQDEQTQMVVRQGSAGLLSGGQPPPFTGNPDLLEGDEDALAAFKRSHTSTPATFRFPTGLTCLPNGLLAVCSDETRITIINQHGFVIKRHSNIGGLRFPRGLTALGGPLLSIADGAHHRILIVDYTTGRVVRELGRLGVPGDGLNDFNCPSGTSLVPGHADILAVCDQMNHRVKLVNWRTGRCVKVIGAGTRGAGEDEFNGPWGITSLSLRDCFVDPSEGARWERTGADEPVNPAVAFAVCDQDNHRVKLITSSGAFIRHIGGSPRGGSGRDDFSRPRAVVALEHGVLCVTDICNHRIKVVDARTGTCLRVFSSITTGCMNRILQPAGTDSARAVEELYPLGITSLPGGDIAVGDRDNHRITVLRP
uniref:Uncharacterized protein n=1 Tax=Neobodo designis TaxID=312471 RepID=A0A7S1M7U6_NEODS